MVNVGTLPGSPSPLAREAGGGQARARLMSPGGGGALVVVRGRESRPHGEGGQPVRSAGTECQERAGDLRPGCPGFGLAAGEEQPRCSLGRGGRDDRPLHLDRAGRAGLPLRTARRAQSAEVPSDAGTGNDDPQAWRQAPPAWHRDRDRPGRAGHPQTGARADLRAGLPAIQIRLPPRAPRSRRNRRDPYFYSHCSSRTESAMLLNTGKRIPP